MKLFSKGDQVWWRGSWGNESWEKAKIVGIELVNDGQKQGGIVVEQIPVEVKDHCVFDLANGHWAYGYQIKEVTNE
jgi:hypothetical protein